MSCASGALGLTESKARWRGEDATVAVATRSLRFACRCEQVCRFRSGGKHRSGDALPTSSGRDIGVLIGMYKWLAAAASVIAVVHVGAGAVHGSELLRVESGIVKWQQAASDHVTVITYTVLTGPYEFPKSTNTLSPDNCGRMRPFSEITSASPSISDATARQELRSAFDAWEQVAGVRFIELKAPVRADIIIGTTQGSIGRAFANLSLKDRPASGKAAKALGGASTGAAIDAFRSVSDGPVAAIEQAYICMNPNLRWKIGFDGNLDVYDLRYTFMHEIGHAIGLDHPGSSGSVMGFKYDERVQQLQSSDISAAQWLYGLPKLAGIHIRRLRQQIGAHPYGLRPTLAPVTSEPSEGPSPGQP